MFIRAQLAVKRGAGLVNKYRLLVLAAYTSRRNMGIVLWPLINSWFNNGQLRLVVYNPADPYERIKVVIRKQHFESDYLSIDELLMYNCYRLPIQINPDIIVDGGGNTGLFSLICKNVYSDKPIHIFEPVNDNLRIIDEHFKANNLNSATVYKGILTRQEGSRYFYIRTANSSSFNNSEPFVEKILIPSFNLVKILKEYTFEKALIKLDIEGAETEVIPDLLESFKTKTLYIVGELHNWPLYLQSLREIVAETGYEMLTYDQDEMCLLFHIYKV